MGLLRALADEGDDVVAAHVLAQELVEGAPPAGCVNAGGVGQDAVEVEENGINLRPHLFVENTGHHLSLTAGN